MSASPRAPPRWYPHLACELWCCAPVVAPVECRFHPLLDSSDMGPTEWIEIAKRIEKCYTACDGFVVIM